MKRTTNVLPAVIMLVVLAGAANADFRDHDLRVTIEPQAAMGAGAAWKVDDRAWKGGGETIHGLSEGEYVVKFNDIDGYLTPPDVRLTLEETTSGDHVTASYPSGTQVVSFEVVERDGLPCIDINAKYLAGEEEGVLGVCFSPQAVVFAGARWRIGSGEWLESCTYHRLPPGLYIVSFNQVEGYVTPESRELRVESGATNEVTVCYEEEMPEQSCGCAKSGLTGDDLRGRLGDLFLAGLALMLLAGFGGRES